MKRKSFYIFFFASAACAALVLLGLSFVSYPTARSLMDGLASDGDAERFTVGLHASVALGARVMAALTLLTSGAYLLLRDSFEINLGLATLMREFHRNWRAWIRTESRLHLGALAFTFGVGVMLRIYYMMQPIRSDEAWTYLHYVSQPALLSLSLYDSPNNHLFHTLLSQVATLVFGHSVFSLRLAAFMAGILLVLASYFLVRQLWGKSAGLIAAGLVACWPALVDYSTNARGYTWLLLFAVLLLAAADRIRRQGDTGPKIIFAILAAFGLYTVPAFGLPLGAVGLWLLLSGIVGDAHDAPPKLIRDICWMAVGAMALTLMLYLPVIWTSGFAGLLGNDVLTDVGRDFPESVPALAAALWIDWTQGVPLPVSLLIVIGLVAASVRPTGHRVPILVPIVVWGALMVALQGVIGPPRVWLFALPFIFGLFAASLTTVFRQERLAEFATIAIVIVGGALYAVNEPGYLYAEEGEFPEAESVARALAGELQDDDALISAFPANRTVNYHALLQGYYGRIERARETALNGGFERLLILLNYPDHTIGAVVDSANRNFQSSVTYPEIQPLRTIAVGSTRIVVARIVSRNDDAGARPTPVDYSRQSLRDDAGGYMRRDGA